MTIKTPEIIADLVKGTLLSVSMRDANNEWLASKKRIIKKTIIIVIDGKIVFELIKSRTWGPK